MEKVQWKVEGMTCANCALTINKYLQQQGAKSISVNSIDGDVYFELSKTKTPAQIAKGVQALGFKVAAEGEIASQKKATFLSNNFQRFLFCLPFTLVLMLHMIPGLHLHFLMNPLVQLALTLPVFIVGLRFFGRSAFNSVRNGVPNMNVLITIGAASAFFYSLAGTVMNLGENFLFYETAATIITLVFFGNYMEEAAVQSTQRSLKALVKSQKVMANMIAFDGEHKEVILPVENTQLKVGDLVLIRTGEQVPADCKILWGEAHVNEAIITGESSAVFKKQKDVLIGGSLVEDGNIKAQVTAAGNDTVLANILTLVKKAQGEKPPVQQMADKISAIFVPVVLGIAVLALAANWIILKEFTPALLRSIAILVIACPCAMGLATPAAIAVGLGRGARNGILFRNAKSLELFKNIEQVVFDKTGTLTTGNFKIKNITCIAGDETIIRPLLYSLEKHSGHPIAKAIQNELLPHSSSAFEWKEITEDKGIGINATDANGNMYSAGSFQMVKHFYKDLTHDIYLLKNNELIATVDIEDEVKPFASEVINELKKRGIRIIMLSGDRKLKCEAVASQTGISEIYYEKLPKEKLEILDKLVKENPTAMIGDGINDAPALALATVGISISNASETAIQSAQVILLDKLDLKILLNALRISEMTYTTIKQNLFWAFFYNVIAIPIAAAGMLNPMIGALSMAFSDVIVIGNSLRLRIRKIR